MDGVLCLLFGALGAVLGWMVVRQAGSSFFYQMFTPEALVWACGHGFRHPPSLSPDMVHFLLDRTAPRFDCASIAADAATGPVGFFFRTQLYFSWIAAGLWRLLGPTQMAMAPLAAALGAGYAAGAFMLVRAHLPRLLAVAGALLLTLSPVALGQIYMLRDFSKAPFVLWTLVLLILGARQQGQRALWLALAAGVIGGVGYAFRADLAIMLPIGVVYIALAAASRPRYRLGLLALYAVSFLVLASPILVLSNGSAIGSLIMQGMTEPFRRFLALRPAPYAVGWAYSDEMTLSGIAAAERPRRPGWGEAEPPPFYGISQAMLLSTANLAEWAPQFPADAMAQALKGAGWILGYPALVTPARGNPDPGWPARLDLPVLTWQAPFYAALGQPWMPLLGFIGVVAWLARVAARSGREAVGLAWLLATLLFYPAIQFSTRHLFHLEFIWLIALLSLPCAILERRLLAPVMPRVMLCVAASVVALAGLYAGLVRWQQVRVSGALEALLALPRTAVPTTPTSRADGSVLWRVEIPAQDRSVVDAPPDSMTDRLPEIGLENDVRAAAERMVLTLSGPSCPAAPASIGLAYADRPGLWQKLDSALAVAPGDQAVFPAFYRATQFFDGVVLPPDHAGCTPLLYRVPMTYHLPVVLTAVLPPDWQNLPLRKGLGRFDTSVPR